MSDLSQATYVTCLVCGSSVAIQEDGAETPCDICGTPVNRRKERRRAVRPVELAGKKTRVRQFVESIPNVSPRDLDERLTALGYRGQQRPRRAVCLAAYRHVRRLKRLYLQEVDRNLLPPKTNCLLMGPTGCGKTFMVELLFREILLLPTVIVDMTTFSETGYIGDDTRTILTRLVYSAGGDPDLAACGIVALDEFDKLASGHNNTRFAGEGTSKDVSGFGVQRELLAMLEDTEVVVPMDHGYSQYGPRVTLPTRDVSFLVCGAFSGYCELHSKRTRGEGLGFRNKPHQRFKEGVAFHLGEDDAQDIESFQAYGFLPELIGRFHRIVPFEPLSRDTLREILVDNVLSRFVQEFEAEGIDLEVDVEVLDAVVSESLKRQTGARGLHASLTRALEDTAFECFMDGATQQVRLCLDRGRIVTVGPK